MTQLFTRRLKQLDTAGDSTFQVLKHEACQHHRDRPLAILIHPGDLIETRNGWNDDAAWQRVAEFSDANLQGTADQLRGWRKAWTDTVVLHRRSCSQFSYKYGRQALKALAKELRACWAWGSVLYGDDLDAAADWLVTSLHIAQRPHIYLAGAYTTPRNGCVTRIGQHIERLITPGKISVSKWAPPGNSAGPTWGPSIDEEAKVGA